jgi:hypothetical protein
MAGGTGRQRAAPPDTPGAPARSPALNAPWQRPRGRRSRPGYLHGWLRQAPTNTPARRVAVMSPGGGGPSGPWASVAAVVTRRPSTLGLRRSPCCERRGPATRSDRRRHQAKHGEAHHQAVQDERGERPVAYQLQNPPHGDVAGDGRGPGPLAQESSVTRREAAGRPRKDLSGSRHHPAQVGHLLQSTESGADGGRTAQHGSPAMCGAEAVSPMALWAGTRRPSRAPSRRSARLVAPSAPSSPGSSAVGAVGLRGDGSC